MTLAFEPSAVAAHQEPLHTRARWNEINRSSSPMT